MQTLKINEHEVVIFKSSEELPIKRYAKFQKYNVLESGVGSDINSIGSHFYKLFELLNFKMSEEAMTEAKNLYYNFYLTLEEVNVKGIAFATLVYSIDGEVIKDLSEDNLKLVVNKLSDIGLTQEAAVEIISDVKKKVKSELRLYSKTYFNVDDNVEFFANVKRKIKLLAESLNRENEQEIKEVDKFFAEYYTPQNFDPDSTENTLIRMDTSFEDLCTTLESNGISSASQLTTMEFYLKLEYFKKLSLKTQKAAV